MEIRECRNLQGHIVLFNKNEDNMNDNIIGIMESML